MAWRSVSKLFFGGTVTTLAYGFNSNSRSYNSVQASTIDSSKRISDFLVQEPHLFDPNKPKSSWDFDWDKRDQTYTVPSSPKSALLTSDELKRQNQLANQPRPTATRHLFLIRHGQYNLKGVTDAERSLTPMGWEQAEFTAQRLEALAVPYTRIIQSSMTRAMNTASVISKHLPNVPVDTCEFLREGAPIRPVPESAHWRPEAQFHEDGARIEAAFRRYFHRADPDQKEDSYEILACHANVIRYFVCRALQFPPEAWLRFSLHNCSITWVAIRPSGRVSVYSIGDIGHLPPHVITTT